MLSIWREGPQADLILDRPEVHNAFHPELIGALERACADLRADRSLRVVVLRGNGPSFCAGADLNWMKASLNYSHAENRADAEALDAMFEALDTLPQALIGRVQGAALGGGMGLVCCCDLAVAADDARFGLTEVRLGLLPAVIARFVVPKIGYGHARARFVSGKRFDAAEALQIGLVQRVVPASELERAVDEEVQELLRCGPEAVAAAKALARATQSLAPAEMAAYAVEAIATARTGPEGQEGLRAFLDKRRPDWA